MIADLRYLNSLMGYDEKRTKKFIEIYKSEIPKQVKLLHLRIDEKNYIAVRTISHDIKSQSAYLMAAEVVAKAKSIELQADTLAENELVNEAKDLEIAVNKVIQLL